MAGTWHHCKNILIVRPDNMGDVIMITPALRALKQTFGCRITLLTSNMGSVITPYISYIDQTIVDDLPWVKTRFDVSSDDFVALVKKLATLHFDGAIISTVYSQNPLPAALMAFMARIPLRLGYCRENPYQLLTDWIPDKEPYSYIHHQVVRELNLVASIGAITNDDRLTVSYRENSYHTAISKLASVGVNTDKAWLIIHPGVSEIKREYPVALWVKTIKSLFRYAGCQILITGSADQSPLTEDIQQQSGEGAFSVAGLFNIEEFIALIAHTQLVISVNTATVHIAAAVNTPVVVLYALTNPQHTPWKVPSVILKYSVHKHLQSKNEVIQFAGKKYAYKPGVFPSPKKIVRSVLGLLSKQAI